ncbi:hypothetical protein [Brevundimonas bullata]|uniref:hypothetical protein n=1 Tax=Brevundimonas bullata TaxID=13160 RepID=UPI003D9AA1E6
MERLKAGSTAYNVEPTGDGGYILVRHEEHAEEFTQLVRDLINQPTDEFVILPTSDGETGYERAVILPL